MDDRSRSFFAGVLQGYRQVSECENPEAAIISREGDLSIKNITLAVSEYLTPDKYFISSPIIDCVLEYLKSKREEKVFILSSCFPNMAELKVIVSAGIKSIYFFGDVSDPDCVKFFNNPHNLKKYDLINLK